MRSDNLDLELDGEDWWQLWLDANGIALLVLIVVALLVVRRVTLPHEASRGAIVRIGHCQSGTLLAVLRVARNACHVTRVVLHERVSEVASRIVALHCALHYNI